MTREDGLAERYRFFARNEATGRSALYEELAFCVSNDAFVLRFLRALPEAKQQPNLLFAAVRQTCGTPSSWEEFRAMLGTHAAAIEQTMLSRGTQTNEPARCAVLLPLLAQLPRPLALIEIGASAGLCLLPDHYRYRYSNGVAIGPSYHDAKAIEPPTFSCEVNGTAAMLLDNLQVISRIGLDLEPVNLDDPEAVRWLENLVWPDEGGRLEQLRRALAIARVQRPLVQKGDLRIDLPNLIGDVVAGIPAEATPVVFHSAVLPYLEAENRQRFLVEMAQLPVQWIANESAAVWPSPSAGESCRAGEFLLRLNGTPVACSDPHGRYVRFF